MILNLFVQSFQQYGNVDKRKKLHNLNSTSWACRKIQSHNLVLKCKNGPVGT